MQGKNTTITTEATKYGSLSLQTATQALPVPLIYGSVKVSSNLLWYGDFTPVQHVQSQTTGGGGWVATHIFGQGTTTTTTITYTYTVGVMFGICEGQVNGFGTVYNNTGTTTYGALGLTPFVGSPTQTPWSYLVSKHPTQAYPYKNIAYLANGALDLGSSNTIPQLWFEVIGKFAGTGVTSADADPATMIVDFLTNPVYGAGFKSSQIDMVSLVSAPNSYTNYLGSLNIAFSDAITTQVSARDYLNNILECTAAAAVWSDGVLKFIPYGDLALTANGYTFTPVTSAAYNLTDDDFVCRDGENPIEMSRADTHDAYNCWQLECIDNSTINGVRGYTAALVESKDQASIEAIGLRTANKMTASFISNTAAGVMCVNLIKNRNISVRNTYRFTLSWEYALLEPMDIVTLTQAGMNLSQLPVRIVSITENDQGLLEIEAEEFLLGAQWAVQLPQISNQGYQPNGYVTPPIVNTPIIFEPPYALVNTQGAQVSILTNGDPATFGGANIWLSTDGTTYYQIGAIGNQAIVGFVDTYLPTYGGTNPDNVNTLYVDISQGQGAMYSVSGTDAANGQSLCYVGGELIGYSNATLVSAGRYALTGLYRGMYGSSVSAHAINAPFGKYDNATFSYLLPTNFYEGQVVYFKFTSFNPQSQMELSLASVTPYVYTITENGAHAGYDANVTESVSASDEVIGSSGSLSADYLVVAGGGGGGGKRGGGGGGGGVLTGSTTIPAGSYSITVGLGGTPSTSLSGNGGNSEIGLNSPITAIGGGGAGFDVNGSAGGSGGGGGSSDGNSHSGGSYTSGQGYAGGNANTGYGGAGGGGAGASGDNVVGTNNGANGGIGISSSITGTAVYYAGGGGGGVGQNNNTAGLGGNGGGGNGSNTTTSGTNGTDNKGGGGGGGGDQANLNGSYGGKGVVIISYIAGSQQATGGTVTSYTDGNGTHWVHSFTTSGTFNF